MNAQHTPAPWSYRPMEHDDWGIVRAPNEQGQFAGGIICQALDPDARDELTLARHREAGTDPWEANARLIAAAPELLEALTGALPALEAAAEELEAEWGKNGGDDYSGGRVQLCRDVDAALAALGAARVAIAKATATALAREQGK